MDVTSKSPVVGSIIITFTIVNWKALYYLLFAEQPTAIRIRFFEISTDFWTLAIWPIIFGTSLALLVPWVNLTGALLVRAPLRGIKKLQNNELIYAKIHRLTAESELVAAQASVDNAKETAKIESERRLKEAELVGNDELKQSILDDRAANSVKTEIFFNGVDDLIASLDDFNRQLVFEMGNNESYTELHHFEGNTNLRTVLNAESPNFTESRLKAKLFAAVLHLKSIGIFAEDGRKASLSEAGYRVFDQLVKKNLYLNG